MAHEIVLDMSETGDAQRIARKRRRNVRDITQYWHTRYGAFIKDGFTDEEAKWGADHGLSLINPTVRKLRAHRRALIRYYMKRGNTRMDAIELASSDLDATLDSFGIQDKNIFYEVYAQW